MQPRQRLWLAFAAGLDINTLANKLLDRFECLLSIKRAKPNSAVVKVGRLPTTVVAHPTAGEMCAGSLTMRISVDVIAVTHS